MLPKGTSENVSKKRTKISPNLTSCWAPFWFDLSSESCLRAARGLQGPPRRAKWRPGAPKMVTKAYKMTKKTAKKSKLDRRVKVFFASWDEVGPVGMSRYPWGRGLAKSKKNNTPPSSSFESAKSFNSPQGNSRFEQKINAKPL